jgi:peptidyl-prolyl cis-trans isomerase SurA
MTLAARTLLGIATLALACLFASPAPAQDTLRIIAVVNDDVITALDLTERLKLVIVSSSLQDTPETRKRLAPQVLRTLIDERIRNQEAKKEGITVPQERIDQRLDQLAKGNNLSRTDFEAVLQRNGLQVDWLADQIRTDIAWATLVQRKFRPTIIVTDEDIDDELQKIRQNQGQPEYLLSEIFLGIDDPSQTDTTEQAAQRLMEQLHSGADFAAVARQFSQSSSAAQGGEVGWVRPGDLTPEINSAIQSLTPGQIAGPIRSEGGFHILQLRDRRTTSTGLQHGTVSLKRIVLPLAAGATPAEVDSANARARTIIGRVTSCEAMNEAATQEESSVPVDLGNVSIEELPPALQAIAADQPIGAANGPVRVENGVGVFMVCERNLTSDSGPSRSDISDQIVRERLDLLARGYIRDLRRSAYVDVRG